MADPKSRKKVTKSASNGEERKPGRGAARPAKEPSGSARGGKGVSAAEKETSGGKASGRATKEHKVKESADVRVTSKSADKAVAEAAPREQKKKPSAPSKAGTQQETKGKATGQAAKASSGKPAKEAVARKAKALARQAAQEASGKASRGVKGQSAQKEALGVEAPEAVPGGKAQGEQSSANLGAENDSSANKPSRAHQNPQRVAKGGQPMAKVPGGPVRRGSSAGPAVERQTQAQPAVQDKLFADDDEKEESGQTPAAAAAAAVPTVETADRKVVADFGLLGLHEGVLAALKRVNYVMPTDVQALCLPHTIEGRDIAGFAQTGTGKTAVFLITASHRLLSEEIKSGEKGAPAVLVLVPTRELAAQIQTESDNLLKDLKISTLSIFGGSADIDKQTKALAKGVDVVVATPGRLFDLHRQGALSLDNVGLLVCDEADRMLDMGFVEDVERVLTLIPEKSQKLLFSATGSTKVHELAFEFLNNPEYIETTPEQITPENITQWCYATKAEEKFPVLLSSIREQDPTCAIVFTNTKVVAEWVGYKLAANGVEAEVLTGDIPQNRRLSLIKAIKNGEMKVLVATDVLSRGLHVTGLSHVYNFDAPEEPESFIHRIGRTARAGAKGSAITFVCEDYGYNMGAVEELLGFPVQMKEIPPAWLQVQDVSEFPFDSTGRVKSIRSLKGGEAASEREEGPRSQSAEQNTFSERERGHHRSDQAARLDRDVRSEQTSRPSQEAGGRPFARDQRPPAAAASAGSDRPARAVPHAKERDVHAPDRMSDRMDQETVVSEAFTARRPADGGRSFDSGRERDESAPRHARPQDDRSAAMGGAHRGRDSAVRSPTGSAAAASGASESRRMPTDQRARAGSTGSGVQSKFVRRDERAKEVIEAALLAAARERELLSLAVLREEVDQLGSRLKSPELARKTAQKVGGGLVKAVRKAAPGLGAFLKRLGSILEQPEESAVTFRADDEGQLRERHGRNESSAGAGRGRGPRSQEAGGRGGRPDGRGEHAHRQRPEARMDSRAAENVPTSRQDEPTRPLSHTRGGQGQKGPLGEEGTPGERGGVQRTQPGRFEERVTFEKEERGDDVPLVDAEVIDQRPSSEQRFADSGQARRNWRGDGQGETRPPRRPHHHDRDRRRPERR